VVFQEIDLERLAWINLWGLNGTECLIKASDRKIHWSLFGLVDIVEGIGLWSD
jgi:hypothetical protein